MKMWMFLAERYGRPFRRTNKTEEGWYYLLSDDRSVLDQWCRTPEWNDTFISGLLADWITEHRSELLLNATGPSDPAERLDQLIEWLRNRFNSQFDQ